MKKIYYLFIFSLFFNIASGQKNKTKPNPKKLDSTIQCKSKPSGKHCAKQNKK